MIPPQIGRYEIKAELGRGGMATVYRAYDPRFKRDVAVKVLPPEFLHDRTFRERFEREAQTIAVLEHAAIVPVYDYGEQDGQPFVVMRHMGGGSLTNRIMGGALDVAEAAHIVDRIGAALDKAHKRGLIHRDVKPSNILFDDDGEAYLSDFGIVKLAESTAHLTGSGIIGTPAYIAPEMGGREGVTSLIDIYALGVTLYQMLTGELPYQSDTPMGLLMAHMNSPIPNIRAQRADLPPDIQMVLDRALAKDPVQRYPTGREFAADLQAVAASRPLSQPAMAGSPASAATIREEPLAAGGAWPPAAHEPRLMTPPPAAPYARHDATPPPPARAGSRRAGFIAGGVAGFVLLCLLAGTVVVGALFLTGIIRLPGSQDQTDDTGSGGDEEEVVNVPAVEDEDPTAAPTPTPEPTATPTLTPPPTPLGSGGGLIAFSSDEDGDSDIYAMNSDGTDVRQLTNDPSDEYAPVWSPDGTQIIFSYQEQGADDPSGLWIMNADGSGMELLLDMAAVYDVNWSPDGSQIAFWAIEDDDANIYIVDLGAGDIEQLTTIIGFGGNYSPRWSPDGQWLTYTNSDISNGENSLQVIDLSTKEIETLATFEEGADEFGFLTSPAWSPDSTQIVFSYGDIFAFSHRLYIVNVDGSNLDTLTPSSLNAGEPAWSPDGSLILFMGSPSGEEVYVGDLYTIQPNGGGLTMLTDLEEVSDGAWSPDGQWILFETWDGDDTRTYLMQANGEGISEVSGAFGAVWQP